MADLTENVITVDKNEGQELSIAGNTYRILISGKQTAGNFAVIDKLVLPGGGPAPHAHPDFQESFYVVEGQVDFKSETGNYSAKTGSFVSIPLGGIVHCFKNTTNSAARLLCTVVPAGLEKFFQEIGKPVQSNGLPFPTTDLSSDEKERLKTVAEKYG